MPLEFTIFHSQRLVVAVARGPILAEEVIAFLARIDAEQAQLYRKLFDLTRLETVFADKRIVQLAETVRGRTGPAGPIAVVARGEYAVRQARLFADAAGKARLVRVFDQEHSARRWLDELGGPIH